MRRADRLFQIVQHLRGGRLVTAKQLSESLGVSERTIYRDIADLSSSGVPIEGAAGVGYVMRKGFELPPLMFTTDEVVALVVGARLLGAFGGDDMASAAAEALVKIGAVLPEPARRRADAVPIYAYSVATDEPGRVRLDQLGTAIDEQRRLQIGYRNERGAETHRSVRPLGLFYWGRSWTLVAWCELRQDFRQLRVDRIFDCEPGLRFTHDPEKSLAKALEGMQANDRR
ncbi:MAG: YafY family transcriptional regulator [Solirubrobacteraceae bacterium]|nr:YafY family transcriptional regulator [Solirubrobacteraceae bacterium]